MNKGSWRDGLTDDEVEQLTPDQRMMLQAMHEAPDVDEEDERFGDLPYSPVYDADGKVVL